MLKKYLKKMCVAILVTSLAIVYAPFNVSAADVVNTYFEANFSNFNSNLFESANWPNGNPFNCVWRPSQVTFSNGSMFLNLTRDDTGSGYPYKSGEYRTKSFFGYGYYEVRMKPAKNVGIVSSFFTYTGPSDNNPWDEIDIEFLGKDTTMVQFNWYKNGVGGNEYYHRLGFDASQDFHTYGFEWRPNYISYYVDGVKVYTGTRNIPSTPGKIMMNLWPGTGVDEWLGRYDGRVPLTAEYKYIRYYPDGFPTATSTPTPTAPPQTPTPTHTPNQPSVVIGDVNYDNKVDSIDFAYFRMYLLGNINDFPTPNDIQAADLNGDWKIDAIDFAYLRMYLLGNITKFPVEQR